MQTKQKIKLELAVRHNNKQQEELLGIQNQQFFYLTAHYRSIGSEKMIYYTRPRLRSH